jgi:hypothetical protein
MIQRILRSAVISIVVAVSLAGCGGAPAANSNEPAGAVKAAFDAAQAGGIAKLADFACAKNKDDIAYMFGGGASQLGALGVDPNDVFDAMKVEFKDVQTTEKSKSGTLAVVHVTGSATVTLDPAKMREVLKSVLAAQGQPVDDATIDIAMNAMGSQLSQTQTMDEDINVVQEGGKWVLCE